MASIKLCLEHKILKCSYLGFFQFSDVFENKGAVIKNVTDWGGRDFVGV